MKIVTGWGGRIGKFAYQATHESWNVGGVDQGKGESCVVDGT